MAAPPVLAGGREVRSGSAGRRGTMAPCLVRAWIRPALGRYRPAPDRPGRAPSRPAPARVPSALVRVVPVPVPSALVRVLSILVPVPSALPLVLPILVRGLPVPAWHPPCGVRP
jgi:hypothetical protein